jgi:nitroimidazol reductase NimA-like FMN-containing flavoprotein (pyridoxamine 5'-phosphate oxidase superfamily)
MVSKEMIQFLIDSDIPVRLSCVSSSNWPIVISLWYVYKNEKLFCATQNTSKIISYLKHSPKCGFEIAGDRFPYRGVRGYGIASILPDKGEDILRMLLEKYFKGKETSALYKLLLSEKHLQNEVAIEIMPFRTFEWNYKRRMSNSITF